MPKTFDGAISYSFGDVYEGGDSILYISESKRNQDGHVLYQPTFWNMLF